MLRIIVAVQLFAAGCHDEPKAAPVPLPAPVDTTPSEIKEAYEANGVAADQRFLGKRLRITANVSVIDKNAAGVPYLSVGLGGTFAACAFDSDHIAELARISRGDGITMVCLGNGYAAGVAQLRGCSIVEVSK